MNVISSVGAKIFTVHCFFFFLGQFSMTGYITEKKKKNSNGDPYPFACLIGILKHPVIYWQKGEISDESHFFDMEGPRTTASHTYCKICML